MMGAPIKPLQRIAIGIYVDSDGVADFRPDEILATLGYPATAENRNEAEQFVLGVQWHPDIHYYIYAPHSGNYFGYGSFYIIGSA